VVGVSVVDALVNVVRKEVQNVMTFVTDPRTGPIETVDKMIVDFRVGLRDILSRLRERIRR